MACWHGVSVIGLGGGSIFLGPPFPNSPFPLNINSLDDALSGGTRFLSSLSLSRVHSSYSLLSFHLASAASGSLISVTDAPMPQPREFLIVVVGGASQLNVTVGPAAPPAEPFLERFLLCIGFSFSMLLPIPGVMTETRSDTTFCGIALGRA